MTGRNQPDDLDQKLWEFVDAAGVWISQSYGFPRMTGRVLGWLLVCEPEEQAAAQLAEALGASVGAISTATGMLVRAKLIDRLRIRGERADRFRVRTETWDRQMFDLSPMEASRELLAQGRQALAGEPAARRTRLEELDEAYAWWVNRVPELRQEWEQYKRDVLRRKL